MQVKDIQARKADLEEKLMDLIKGFEEDTGVTVDAIHYRQEMPRIEPLPELVERFGKAAGHLGYPGHPAELSVVCYL